MKSSVIALLTVLLEKNENRQECCRGFVELKTIPTRGSYLKFRGCTVSVVSVTHTGLEPSVSEWSDLLENNEAEFDLELVCAPVQMEAAVELLGHPLKGACL